MEGMSKEEKNKVKKECLLNMKLVKVPTVINFYDSTQENDILYIYMEYADGGPLQNKINEYKIKGQQFSYDQILEWLVSILLALYELNKQNMIHRDIKTENILLKKENLGGTEFLIAKLSDLGISREKVMGVGSMTLCGTPYYVSPEIASQMTHYDFNTDIWSLGVVLYELATLKKPFGDPSETEKRTNQQEITTEELYMMIRTQKYTPIEGYVDPRLKFLIKKMLTKNPKLRPTVVELLKVDFIYEKLMEIVMRYGWSDKFNSDDLFRLGKNKNCCYVGMELINFKDMGLILEAEKLLSSINYTPYKKSMFSGKIMNTVTNQDLVDTYQEIFENKNEEEVSEFFQNLIDREILISKSHEDNFGRDFHLKNLSPKSYNENVEYFIFSFDAQNDKFDNYQTISVKNIFLKEYCDVVTLSQYILYQGKIIFKNIYLKNFSEEELFSCEEYINFLTGIFCFKNFELFADKNFNFILDNFTYSDNNGIPIETDMCETENSEMENIENTLNNLNIDENSKPKVKQAKLAFLLNLYQIMLIHYSIKIFTEKHSSKGGLMSYFSNEVGIRYKFSDTIINNLELKHVIFRNNKKPPGNYLRLANSKDPKTQILPNFTDLRPLLILQDFHHFNYTNFGEANIFEIKGLEIQLNNLVVKFIYQHVYLDGNTLNLPKFMENYVCDFNAEDKPELPISFLKFLAEFYNVNIKDRDKFPIFKLIFPKETEKGVECFTKKDNYKENKGEEKEKKILFLTLLKMIQNKNIKVTYS
jgi:serine/threonine protein kinase